MAKTKFEVEQEDKAPEGEDQRQRKLIKAPRLVVVISATVPSLCAAFVAVVIVDGLAFGS